MTNNKDEDKCVVVPFNLKVNAWSSEPKEGKSHPNIPCQKIRVFERIPIHIRIVFSTNISSFSTLPLLSLTFFLKFEYNNMLVTNPKCWQNQVVFDSTTLLNMKDESSLELWDRSITKTCNLMILSHFHMHSFHPIFL